jgi:hypothetical protein
MPLCEEPSCAAAWRPSCRPESTAPGEAADSDASTEYGSSGRIGTPPEGRVPARAPRVHFRDDALAEVVEVESWKEHTRFTPDSRARADGEWRSRLLVRLQGAQGEVDRQHAAEQLEGAVVELATAVEESGSLAVQRALELAPLLQRVRLMRELHGRVPGLLRSPHGGEVLRACLRLLPVACGFIAREIDGHALDCLWLHGGAEVLCELLRCLPTAQVAPIKTELLERVNLLCHNPQGGQVIRTLLECGACKDQQQTAEFFSNQIKHMSELTRGVLECHMRAATASRHP